jgi:hypothetical protein
MRTYWSAIAAIDLADSCWLAAHGMHWAGALGLLAFTASALLAREGVSE